MTARAGRQVEQPDSLDRQSCFQGCARMHFSASLSRTASAHCLSGGNLGGPMHWLPRTDGRNQLPEVAGQGTAGREMDASRSRRVPLPLCLCPFTISNQPTLSLSGGPWEIWTLEKSNVT